MTAALTCTVCGAPLSGKLDTFGAVGEPTCLACFVRVPDAGEIPEDPDPFDDDFDDESDGLIEHHGELYCGACGILACPGEEEFDWCNHIEPMGCYHYFEEVETVDEYDEP